MKTGSASKVLILTLIICGACTLGWGFWIPAKAIVAQHLLDISWKRKIAGENNVKPWPWADISPVFQLSLPANKKSFIVLDNASGEALAFGPGHVTSSFLPGENGYILIGGHRDTHFSFLDSIQINDVITIDTVDGKQFHYSVTQIATRHKDSAYVSINNQTRLLVLSTCFPISDVTKPGPERLLVIARQI